MRTGLIAVLCVVGALPVLAVEPSAAGTAWDRDGLERLVCDISVEAGLDPELVRAVVIAESGFNPDAVSHKGACGLMQLMPATAKRLRVRNAFDPADNVRGGVTELSRLIARYEGELPLALAAYNAGEGAVERYGGVPPFRETSEYVRRILRLYRGESWFPGQRRAAVKLVRDGSGVVITNQLSGGPTTGTAATISLSRAAAPLREGTLGGGFGK